MPCGQLILKDPSGSFWSLAASNIGALTTQRTIAPLTFSPPVLRSASFNWQLSATIAGLIQTTQTATPGPSIAIVASPNGSGVTIQITDAGVLTTALNGVPFNFGPARQNSLSMSVFADLGLTSTLSGATPLILGADFSIWSCSLQKYIPVDSTNIIVVYEE